MKRFIICVTIFLISCNSRPKSTVNNLKDDSSLHDQNSQSLESKTLDRTNQHPSHSDTIFDMVVYKMTVDYLKRRIGNKDFSFPQKPENIIHLKDSTYTVTAHYYEPINEEKDKQNDYNIIIKYNGGNINQNKNWEIREFYLNNKMIINKDL